MAKDEWFRNTEWNDEIEKAFFLKLQRARDKAQYLRIQASTLAESYPKVAHRLLDQYFSLGDHFDLAQAYVDRASAFLAEGKLEEAFKSFEAALTRENEFPNLKTQACLRYPFLVAVYADRERYELSLQLLEKHQSEILFPVDHFYWHAARSLILAGMGRREESRKDAEIALEAAGKETSGFRYHREVGLVNEKYTAIQNRLEEILKI